MIQESRIDPTIVAELKSNNDDQAFARLGANTPQNKKRRKNEALAKDINEYRADKKGWSQAQVKAFDQKRQAVVDKIRDPEFQKNPGWQSEAFKMMKDLKDTADITTTTAMYANGVENKYDKEDHDMLEGYDEFSEVYNPAFGMMPSTDGQSRYADINEINAQMMGRARNVKEIYEYDYEVPDYGWTTNINEFERKDGKIGETTRYTLPKEQETLLRTDAVQKYISGKRSAAGQARVRNKADETFTRDVDNYVKENYSTQLNSISDEEELAKFYEDKATELWKQKSLQGYNQKNKTSLPSKGRPPSSGKKYNPEDYSITTESFDPSTITVAGKNIAMGTGERPVVAVPKARVNIPYEKDGRSFDTEGDVQKIFLDSNGVKSALVNVKVKGDGRSGLSSEIETIVVPYESIRGELKKDELDLYETKYEEMAKIGVKETGMSQEEADKFNKDVEKLRKGVVNNSSLAEKLVTDVFGEEVAKTAKDPSWDSDDISFTVNGKKYSFNLDDREDRQAFTELVAKHKKGTKNDYSKYGGEVRPK